MGRMPFFSAGNGWTAWEFQAGPLYGGLVKPRYWQAWWRPGAFLGWDRHWSL